MFGFGSFTCKNKYIEKSNARFLGGRGTAYFFKTSISPITALLWCLYPISILVIIELLLGGGFDDDNNDDQDGGMLIPAYSRSNI